MALYLGLPEKGGRRALWAGVGFCGVGWGGVGRGGVGWQGVGWDGVGDLNVAISIAVP